jgi:hypothetical protein
LPDTGVHVGQGVGVCAATPRANASAHQKAAPSRILDDLLPVTRIPTPPAHKEPLGSQALRVATTTLATNVDLSTEAPINKKRTAQRSRNMAPMEKTPCTSTRLRARQCKCSNELGLCTLSSRVIESLWLCAQPEHEKQSPAWAPAMEPGCSAGQLAAEQPPSPPPTHQREDWWCGSPAGHLRTKTLSLSTVPPSAFAPVQLLTFSFPRARPPPRPTRACCPARPSRRTPTWRRPSPR